MENRIHHVQIIQGRLDPMEAELGTIVRLEYINSATQIRGRLMGPRCRYASTVEVAYPFSEYARKEGSRVEGYPRIISRLIIPEPSFWDPNSPHLYEGPIELWQDGQLCDQVKLRHGLRTLSMNSSGILWNSRPVMLRGLTRVPEGEKEALQLHQAGCDTLLLPFGDDVSEFLDIADELGFFVVLRCTQKDMLGCITLQRRYPSHLAWVLDAKQDRYAVLEESYKAFKSQLIGIELSEPPTESLVGGIRFVVCEEKLLAALAGVKLPKLVLKAAPLGDIAGPGSDAALEVILGWITT